MGLGRSVSLAEHLTYPASTRTRCDATKSTTGRFYSACWVFEINAYSLTHSRENIHELEQRIQSLQDKLNEAHASKRRRLPSDEDTGTEHVQLSELSDMELPSPRNDTDQASFEAEADGDGGSYTLKTPKGAMRFFGECWLTEYYCSRVARMAADATD